VRDSDMQTR